MNDCPFCARIAAGEYDYHDDHAVAFQPLNPVTPGHFLVVPRMHIASALEPLAPILLGGTMRLAAILARQMDLTDCNFINSAGAAASQTVPHLHVHVVPRREGDGLALPWAGQRALLDFAVDLQAVACSRRLQAEGPDQIADVYDVVAGMAQERSAQHDLP
jgi:histidine triad (HIT) family protein